MQKQIHPRPPPKPGRVIMERQLNLEPKKPTTVIATRFHISVESARYFLGNVQKSFKKEKPPQQMILDFMQGQKFKTLPSPHQVATLMKAAGLWDHPLNAAPPGVVDEEDKY